MKLLFDQNLSRKLVVHVRDVFPESVHVASVALETATDQAVWDFARQNGFCIASKDSDFRQLAFLHGPPPKVIWLRVGNVSTLSIAELLLNRIELIEVFLGSEDESLLVISPSQESG